MVGQHQDNGFRQHNIALTEALDVKRGQPGVLETVIGRECVGMTSNQFNDADRQMCVLQVQQEIEELAMTTAVDGQDTISALRRLLTALQGIDAPKTVVLLSEGFLMQDQIQEVADLGMLAAAARTSIYALRLDDQPFMADAAQRFGPIATMSDRSARGQGMETLVAASRGALFNVVGTGETIFEHMTAELSGYYLLGVESGPTDKDGKTHPIRVDVNRKGLTVRSRRALINATEIRKPRNAREAIISALETPLPLSALPLRVATYSLQGPEADKVQILIHADVGIRLLGVAHRLARLSDHRRERPSRRQSDGEYEVAAGDERCAVSTAVCRRRQLAGRSSTRSSWPSLKATASVPSSTRSMQACSRRHRCGSAT